MIKYIKKLKKLNNSLLFVILLGLVVRIFFAFTAGTGDTGAFHLASSFFIEGREVYQSPEIAYSAPPFGLHITAVSNLLSRWTGIPFSAMWKMPSIFADVGIAYLLYNISLNYFRTKKQTALFNAKLYMWNPIAIVISGAHGQQDAFWVFFMMLAWYFVAMKKNVILASVASSVAIGYKLTSLLLFPPLLLSIARLRSRLGFFFLVTILFIISLFPEIVTSTKGVVRQSFMYASTPGVWGIPLLTNKFSTLIGFPLTESILIYISRILQLVLLACLAVYFLLHRKQNFFQISLNILIIFFILAPGFATQYLLWPLPFLILLSSPYIFLYTLLIAFGFLHTYGLPLPTIIYSTIDILKENIYYKLNFLYPYDLYIPVWILFILMFFSPKRIPTIIKKLFLWRYTLKLIRNTVLVLIMFLESMQKKLAEFIKRPL